MKTQNSERKEKPNLTAALRILQNAGIKDPRLLSEDPDVQIQFIVNALCDLSIHDGLTGLANAPFFHAVLAREIDRSLRTGRTCALMVVDIDHFKKINDTYGRNTGDEVLRSVADRMKQNLRGMDTAARIGGDTFAIILPECETENAIRAATRIHSALNPLAVRIKQNTIRLITSVGLVWTHPNFPIRPTALLSEAGQELYRAKRSGRGCLCYKCVDSTLMSRQERSALMTVGLEEGAHGY